MLVFHIIFISLDLRRTKQTTLYFGHKGRFWEIWVGGNNSFVNLWRFWTNQKEPSGFFYRKDESIMGGVGRDEDLCFKKEVDDGLEAKIAVRAKRVLVNCNRLSRVFQGYSEGLVV